jgi:hypothetical protein
MCWMLKFYHRIVKYLSASTELSNICKKLEFNCKNNTLGNKNILISTIKADIVAGIGAQKREMHLS